MIMKCYAEQNNLQSAGGTSGESSICVATPVGSFIGDIMKQIPLNHGKYAIVDDWNYERLMKHKWQAKKHRYTYYAVAAGDKVYKNNKRTILRMHREILGLKHKDGILTDHINHNGLDNREANLRICTNAQSVMNRRKIKKKSSKYKGVSFYKAGSKWSVNVAGIHVGYFYQEEKAAKVYNDIARIIYGEYAYMNEI